MTVGCLLGICGNSEECLERVPAALRSDERLDPSTSVDPRAVPATAHNGGQFMAQQFGWVSASLSID